MAHVFLCPRSHVLSPRAVRDPFKMTFVGFVAEAVVFFCCRHFHLTEGYRILHINLNAFVCMYVCLCV